MAVASLIARVSAQTAEFETAFKSATRTAKQFAKDFETTGTSVQAQQDRISRAFANFSGDKLAREADAVAKAVDRIGGASKLTASEQTRVNAVVTEAIAKYQALGQQAPRTLIDLEQATRRVAAATEPLTRTTSIFGQSLDTIQSKGSLAERAMGALTGTFGKFTLAGVAVGIINKLGGELSAFIDRGTKLGPVQQSFEKLSATVQQNSGAMLSALQTATQGMVSNYDLMLSANKAVLLGLPVTANEMGNLAETARVLGKAMGLDTTQALNDLITALGRSSPLILDNLGLTVKVGEANEAYSAKLGKTADALTEAEKKTAFYEAAMEKAREKTRELGDQTKTLGEIATTVWTRLGNVVSSTVSFINTAGGAAISGVANAFSSLGGFFSDVYGNGLKATVQTRLFNTALATTSTVAAKVAQTKPIPPDYVTQLETVRKRVADLTAEQVKQIKAAETLGGDALKAVLERYKLEDVHLKVLNNTTKEAVKVTKDFGREGSTLVTRVTKADEASRALVFTMGKLQASFRADAITIATSNLEIQERQLKATTDAWLNLMKSASAEIPALKNRDLKDIFGDIPLPSLDRVIPIPPSVTDRITSALSTVSTQADDLSRAFGFLADVTQNSLIQGLRDLFVSVTNATGAGKQLAAGWAEMRREGGSLMSGLLQMAQGVIAGIASVMQSTSRGSTGSRVAGGALSGAALGTAILPGWGTAIGAAAGAITGLIRGLNQGRSAIKDWVAANHGDFDTLHKKLIEMGREDLWILATQKVGRGSGSQAADAIAALEDAFAKGRDAAKAQADEFSAAGFKTRDELEQTARTAVSLYQRMKDSGKFTASELQRAFVQAQEAMRNAMADTSQLDAMDAIKGKIGELNQEYQRLFQAVSNEAPEEEMGVIERQMRDRMQAIEQERGGLENQLKQMTLDLENSFASVADNAKDAAKAIADAFANLKLTVPVTFDVGAGAPGIPSLGSGGIVRRPTLALIGESGPEAVVPLSGNSANPVTPVIINKLYLDGREIAHNQVRHFPEVASLYVGR